MKRYIFGKQDKEITSCDCDCNNNNKNHNNVNHNCNINFYSDITDETISDLNGMLQEKSFDLLSIQCQYELEIIPPLHLHLQSFGGDIFSGIAGMEAIRTSKVPIYTYVNGIVASAATLLSIVGEKRYINKEACMLIHQISSGFWGKFGEFEDELTNLNLIMSKLKKIYKQYTKLDDTILNELLKHDLYLESDMCLQYGLVDYII